MSVIVIIQLNNRTSIINHIIILTERCFLLQKHGITMQFKLTVNPQRADSGLEIKTTPAGSIHLSKSKCKINDIALNTQE